MLIIQQVLNNYKYREFTTKLICILVTLIVNISWCNSRSIDRNTVGVSVDGIAVGIIVGTPLGTPVGKVDGLAGLFVGSVLG